MSLFQQAAAQAGISEDRIRACVADDSHSGAALPAGMRTLLWTGGEAVLVSACKVLVGVRGAG